MVIPQASCLRNDYAIPLGYAEICYLLGGSKKWDRWGLAIAGRPDVGLLGWAFARRQETIVVEE